MNGVIENPICVDDIGTWFYWSKKGKDFYVIGSKSIDKYFVVDKQKKDVIKYAINLMHGKNSVIEISEKIKGEFSNNGIDNNISHTRGTISMARSSAYNSASSQFFIMQKDTTSLDGQYAAFGTVTDGMDIVDKICKDCTDTNQNGVITDKSKQPVITKISVID